MTNKRHCEPGFATERQGIEKIRHIILKVCSRLCSGSRYFFPQSCQLIDNEKEFVQLTR